MPFTVFGTGEQAPPRREKLADGGRLYFEEKYMEMGEKLRPEARLPMAMASAFCYPVCQRRRFQG